MLLALHRKQVILLALLMLGVFSMLGTSVIRWRDRCTVFEPGYSSMSPAADLPFVMTAIVMRPDEPQQIVADLNRFGFPLRVLYYQAQLVDLDLASPSANPNSVEPGTAGCLLSHLCVASNFRNALAQRFPPHSASIPPFLIVIEADAVVAPSIGDFVHELRELETAIQHDLAVRDDNWTIIKLATWGTPQVDGEGFVLPKNYSTGNSRFIKTTEGVRMFGGTQAYVLNPRRLDAFISGMQDSRVTGHHTPFHADNLVNTLPGAYLYYRIIFEHGASFHTRALAGRDRAQHDSRSTTIRLESWSDVFNFYCNNDLGNKLRYLL